ncbi:MAG: hypothetical protein HGB18_03270 [Candidatus Moranbacteria bacterium]|nr:hypothetical protein [Candidatus Moranbacteria bacterium]
MTIFHKTVSRLLIAFLVVFMLASVRPAFAADGFTYEPLEPIPGAEDAAKLPDYITGIYKFALWAVGIAAMFMITIGGGMYLTSAGNTSAMGNAKGVITDAIIGLVLALFAWFLLNLINPSILSGDLSVFSTVGVASSGSQAAGGTTSGATGTSGQGAVSTVNQASTLSAAAAAKALLASSNVTISSSGDCKSASGAVSPSSNLTEMSSGKAMTTCHDGCKSGSLCTGSSYANATLLNALFTASNSASLTINSLAGGDHSAGSAHYSGNAADIDLPNAALTSYLQKSSSTTCTYKGGAQYRVNGVYWWYEDSSHIHVQMTPLC